MSDNFTIPIAKQEHNFDEIAKGAITVWTKSMAGILMLSESQMPSSVALNAMLAEIKRLMRKFIHQTPNDFSHAIREAHRKALNLDFVRVTVADIENEMNQLILSRRNDSEKMLLSDKNKNWYGSPYEALDRNWPTIWRKTLLESIERGEKVRRFEFDYLDAFNDQDREERQIRDRAFLELCRRVRESEGFSMEGAMVLCRKEMHKHLLAAYPRYKGDIEKEIWSLDFDKLNQFAAELRGRCIDPISRHVPRPTTEACARFVWFDLYCEMMGCAWPELTAKPAPKQADLPPKPNWSAIPKDLDSIDTNNQ